MIKGRSLSFYMRVTHRYLGYFLAGIMIVYALSGMVLIYRDQEFLKKEVSNHVQLPKNLSEKKLGRELRIKQFEVTKNVNGVLHFKQGTYDSNTGIADYESKEYPYVLDKMVSLHKAKSEDPLSPLNAFFGASLLIYVITSFWMFRPKTKVFKQGMIVTVCGLVLGFLLLFL